MKLETLQYRAQKGKNRTPLSGDRQTRLLREARDLYDRKKRAIRGDVGVLKMAGRARSILDTVATTLYGANPSRAAHILPRVGVGAATVGALFGAGKGAIGHTRGTREGRTVAAKAFQKHVVGALKGSRGRMAPGEMSKLVAAQEKAMREVGRRKGNQVGVREGAKGAVAGGSIGSLMGLAIGEGAYRNAVKRRTLRKVLVNAGLISTGGLGLRAAKGRS